MEAISISMTCKKLTFLVKDDLSSSAEETFHELCVSLCENCRHQNVDWMPNNFIFAI